MIDIAASLEEMLELHSRGVAIHKPDSDLARYEEVLDRVRPDLLIESGLYYGGSASWFAERVPRVVSIELNGKYVREYLDGLYGAVPPNVAVVHGNSLGDDTFQLVSALAEGVKTVMVVLDSDHGTETVLMELRRYSPLVTIGSYIVAEDGILAFYQDNWFAGDPLQAITRFLEEAPEFEADDEVEAMFPTTQHVSGWLRRQ